MCYLNLACSHIYEHAYILVSEDITYYEHTLDMVVMHAQALDDA